MRHRHPAPPRPARRPAPPSSLLPIAALLVGLGHGVAIAQTGAPSADPPAAGGAETMMPAVKARGAADAPSGKDSLRTTTTRIGRGTQDIRDVPQSMTVVTEQLIDDRHLDTLKDALRATGGIAFQAAEGAEEDIRLRGFSLQGSGDIFIDGIRDPAFYERDSFAWDRLEVLRGSASMLFGRGSTGGVVNQVTKQPYPWPQHEVSATVGTGGYLRATGDFNFKTGESSALRINAMGHVADNDGAGNRIDKRGLAATYRWGIGMADEFGVGLLWLENDNGIQYGLPWLAPGARTGGDYIWRTDPRNYYGMDSDRNRSGTTQGTLTHLHRFEGGAEWRTALRVARYERDLRGSAIRFAPAAQQPGGQAVTSDTFSDATVLTRGTNLKIQEMRTVYLQSDYAGTHRIGGLEHRIQAGVDVADEGFSNFGATLPAGVSLVKPTTTVGTPDDGAWIDEGLRRLAVNRRFDARAYGAYLQDLVQVAPMWKVLGGVRFDRFEGTYDNVSVPAQANNPCGVTPATSIGRTDSLPSYRAGVLFQPTERQSWHLSYGTSYNTSGDAYQYDAGTVKVDPESSRNIELGGRIESEDRRFSTRFAVFHSTKFNERNRDADTVNACNYVLSGKRHAAGIELDLAGRPMPKWDVWMSYTYIPIAEVDESSGAAGTEPVGSRPGLTPRHSGSLWTTYRVLPALRVGGGLTARSKDAPVGLPLGSPIVAPAWASVDLMAEYAWRDLTFKASLLNVADAHYADFLYRGHYVPGRGRTALMTVAYRF